MQPHHMSACGCNWRAYLHAQVELIAAAMPSAKQCFLYRNAAPNIESWHAMLQRSQGEQDSLRLLLAFHHISSLPVQVLLLLLLLVVALI